MRKYGLFVLLVGLVFMASMVFAQVPDGFCSNEVPIVTMNATIPADEPCGDGNYVFHVDGVATSYDWDGIWNATAEESGSIWFEPAAEPVENQEPALEPATQEQAMEPAATQEPAPQAQTVANEQPEAQAMMEAPSMARLRESDSTYRLNADLSVWARAMGFEFETLFSQARNPIEQTFREENSDDATVLITGFQAYVENVLAPWPACFSTEAQLSVGSGEFSFRPDNTMPTGSLMTYYSNLAQPHTGIVTLHADCRSVVGPTDHENVFEDPTLDAQMTLRAARLIELNEYYVQGGSQAWLEALPGVSYSGVRIDAVLPQFDQIREMNDMITVVSGLQVNAENLAVEWPACFTTDAFVDVGDGGRLHRPDRSDPIANPSILYTNIADHSGTVTLYGDCSNWGQLAPDEYDPFSDEFSLESVDICLDEDYFRAIDPNMEVGLDQFGRRASMRLRFPEGWTRPSGYILDHQSQFKTSVGPGAVATVWQPEDCLVPLGGTS